MDSYRLKIKLGEFEFDAEGPHDVVQAQFQAFQEMVANMPQRAATPPAIEPKPPEQSNDNGGNKTDRSAVDNSLPRIMKVENRVVSLTAPPNSVEDAVLLIIFGQRILRDNEAVTGSEVVDGMTATGGLDIGRSDRLLERLARSGDLIMIGERRGKRYRLTNTGMNKARQIAARLIDLVA